MQARKLGSVLLVAPTKKAAGQNTAIAEVVATASLVA
jgi:hypothetical protein